MKKIVYLLLTTILAACSAQAPHEDAAQVADKLIMSRRSIRQYTAQPVSRDTLEQILNCGINAPNGRNRQSYEIRVVDNPELLKAMWEAVRDDNPTMDWKMESLFFGAPCVIFLANDTSYDMAQVDCGLLGENIILKAWSMGLGTCCAAHPVRQMKESSVCAPIIEKLGFSQGFNLLYSIAIGYPAENPEARPRRNDMIKFVE